MTDNYDMNIHLGDSDQFLELANISKERAEDDDFLKVTIRLNLNGITTNIHAVFLRGELIQFYKDLMQFYETLNHQFVLSNLEDNISVNFSPTPNGHLMMSGYLRNN